MRNYTCQICHFSFSEADKAWDVAVSSGKCPKCGESARNFPALVLQRPSDTKESSKGKLMKVLGFIVTLPFLIIIVALQVFFLPYSIVVRKRQDYPGAKTPTVMFILNIAFGWTLVGWLILLVIAQAMPD